jgi:hypothetical protein
MVRKTSFQNHELPFSPIEPLCTTERYTQWYERTATQIMGGLLLDYKGNSHPNRTSPSFCFLCRLFSGIHLSMRASSFLISIGFER